MLMGASNCAWGETTSYGSAAFTSEPTQGGWFAVQETGNVKMWGYNCWADGNGPVVIDSKIYAKLTSDGFIKLRIAKGSVLPGDILRVDVAGYYGILETLGYTVEGSNTFVSKTEIDTRTATIDYTLKAEDIQNDSDAPENDMIIIKRSDGGSGYCYHSFEILTTDKYSVSIDLSKFSSSTLPSGCDAWFTLNGGSTQYRTTQANVPVGTTVTYTMSSTDKHYTPSGWRTRSWTSGDPGWRGYNASFTTTVINESDATEDQKAAMLFGDLNAAPEFHTFFFVSANAETGGSATVSDAGGHDMSKGYESNNGGSASATTGSLTFTATPNSGYTFEGWYKDGTLISNLATYTYGNYTSSVTDLTLTAKFTKIPVSKPTVDADFTDRGHGSNINVTDWESEKKLNATANNDNWANIFVFPTSSDTRKNVTKSADNYSGVTITANGAEYRLLIFTDNTTTATKIERITASTKNVSKSYTWADLGIASPASITRIAVAGSSTSPGITTFSGATLLPVRQDATGSIDFSTTATTKKGGNATWTIASGNKSATLETSNTSDNMKYLYDFTSGGNMEGHSALEFTGIRFNTIGNRFRVIAYVNGGTTSEDRYVGYVTNTGEDTKFEDPNKTQNKTQHFQWSDLKVQWGSTPMTDDKVSQITHIAVAGDDAAASGKVVFSNVWLETINDYDHTFVCYGEEGGSYKYISATDGEYTYNQNGSKVVFQPFLWNSRDTSDEPTHFNSGCTKLPASESATFTAPANSKFKTLKVIYADGTSLEVAPDNNTYTLTNSTSETQLIAKVEFVLDNTSINESHTITSSYESRDYWLYVPVSVLTAASGTFPVVFSLHGTSNDYEPTNGGVQNFNELAEQNQFIVVYPRGKMRRFPGFDGGANLLRGWDSDGMKTDNKDIQFFRDIVNDLTTNQNLYGTDKNLIGKINSNKIYITGYSNGGMMTYAAANAAPDLFAAFASVSGLPMNEFHLQTNGDRPVPFLHIHGTKDDFVKYTHMPTIVDNMIYRNGCYPIPDPAKSGSGDATVYGSPTQYKMSYYSSSDIQVPYVYYEIGTGMTEGDTGMGHNKECVIGGVDSKKIIWDFLKEFSLSGSGNAIEFRPSVEVSDFKPEEHGWVVDNNKVIYQYGETSTSTGNNQYVYHSLQLKPGNHQLIFKARNANASKWVTARIEKIADIKYINDHCVTEPIADKTIFEKHYTVAGENNIVVNFTTDTDGEYRLTFLAGGELVWDGTLEKYVHGTTISNVNIYTGSGTPTQEYKPSDETDFTGYFNYHNRLVAQWNFDLCDYRFFTHTALNSDWVADYTNASKDHKYGTIVYKYNKALSKEELKYNGTTLIPISAGLQFEAGANKVQFIVEVSNGEVTGTRLQLEEGVKVYVPYIENTYRNNNGIDTDPSKPAVTDDYKSADHHIKRDILYVASETKFWDEITNKYTHNAEERTMFNDGGIEKVDGLTFYKLNYTGEQGEGQCFFEVKSGRTAVINRIGVNRNLTYSFFTENIAATTGYIKPYPGMRIVGSPQGAAIANIGDTYKTYDRAIAVTYGGWKYNNGNYSSPDGQRTDYWDELTVNNKNLTEAQVLAAGVENTPIPTDGFPVYSNGSFKASSEGCSGGNGKYHPADYGTYIPTTYTANLVPWSLPCRGTYVKFEPTMPGVLNVHLYQQANKTYYVSDEFGMEITTFQYKMGKTGNMIHNSTTGTVKTTTNDYVRYSFDVKPGKSYYIFSNDATLTGFSGFYFEPLVKIKEATASDPSTRQNVVVGLWELPADGYPSAVPAISDIDHTYYGNTAETAKDNITAFNGISPTIDAVRVQLGREFKENTWSSICLPFSMNNLEMEKVFGEGTRVVLLRDIQDRTKSANGQTTINFIAHENQDIIAGYPYFIYPTKKVNAWDRASVALLSQNDYDYFIATPANVVSVSSKGYNTITGLGDYDGMEGYQFEGTLTDATLPSGSYALSASTGQLVRVANDITVGPYKAYLRYTGEQTTEAKVAKAIQAISFFGINDDDEGQTTAIEDILLESGIVGAKTNVYNLNGQLVRANTVRLEGLPKGAYLVNGKKYIVR